MSPGGCVHLLNGTTDAPLYHGAVASPDQPTGLVPITAATGPVAGGALFPLSDIRYGATPAADTEWRLVSATHTMRFTGSALNNGGSLVITPCDYPRGREAVLKSTDGAGTVYCVASSPSGETNQFSLVGAARDTMSVLQVPRDSSFQPVRTFVGAPTGDTRVPFVPVDGTGKPCAFWAPALNTRIYEVAYTGLSADATITLESNICVQSLISESNTAYPFAQPSERANPTLLSAFLSAVNSSVSTVMRGVDVPAMLRSAVRSISDPVTRAAISNLIHG